MNLKFLSTQNLMTLPCIPCQAAAIGFAMALRQVRLPLRLIAPPATAVDQNDAKGPDGRPGDTP
jgi:hypothetical protein